MKMPAIKLGTMISALVFCVSTQSTMAQNFYKWVDAKGSTHYTTTPPPNSAKKKGKVETYGWKNSTAPASAHEASPAAQSAAEEAENAATEKASTENKSTDAPQPPSEE